MTTRSGSILIILVSAVFYTAFQYTLLAQLPREPQVAGASTSIGGYVPETPQNRRQAELNQQETQLNQKAHALALKEKSLNSFFLPSENSVKILYSTILFLLGLLLINLYYDLKILKNRKINNHA